MNSALSSWRRHWLGRALIGSVGLLGAAYLAICVYASTALTAPPRNLDLSRTPAAFGAAFEEVRFASQTPGLKLDDWYVPRQGADRALVMVHGHTSSRTTEFKGRFVELVVALHLTSAPASLLSARRLLTVVRGHWQIENGLHYRRDVTLQEDAS